MMYLGDFPEDATVRFGWSTNDADGASITRATDGTISVYKDGGTSQSAAGVTDTEDFDSLTGVHLCAIDTSADAFYEAGSEYMVVLSGASIDGQTVNHVLAHFSIERDGGTLALLKGANGLQAIKAETAAILDDTGSSGVVVASGSKTGYSLSADQSGVTIGTVNALGTQAKADVNAEADAALSDYDPPTRAEATADKEEIISQGDSAWATATGFSTHSAADVWSVATRTLSAGTNIVLAKGAGITGFNDLDSTAVQNAAAAALTAYDPPTKAEMDALIGAPAGDDLAADLAAVKSVADAIQAVTDLLNAAQSEPTGTPAANATPLVKLAWLFMALRNGLQITSGKKQFLDDAGNVEWEKDLADDGTTYSETKANAP